MVHLNGLLFALLGALVCAALVFLIHRSTTMPDNKKLVDLTAALRTANQQIAILSTRATTAEATAADYKAQLDTANASLDALPDATTIASAEAEIQTTLDTLAASTPAGA